MKTDWFSATSFVDWPIVTFAQPLTTIQCSARWRCDCSDSAAPGSTTMRFTLKRSPSASVSYTSSGAENITITRNNTTPPDGVDYWRNGRFIVSTDDAYVGAEMATVSAKLSANIASVSARQNQEVKAGQPLVALDDGDWRIALDSARAKSATAQATLAKAQAIAALVE